LDTDAPEGPPDLSGVNLDTVNWSSPGPSGQWNWNGPGEGSNTDIYQNLDDVISDIELSLNVQFYKDFPDDDTPPMAPETSSTGGLPTCRPGPCPRGSLRPSSWL
jgi:hypothetical protein